MMPVAQLDQYKVLHITTLGKDRDADARELLERVAKQVQPIMRKRQWTVHRLSEFIPRSPNLLGLNVNRGRDVRIRLRPAGREHSFYDWNHILGTMLHELCHNRIGPHNAEFYKLLDELWTEAEELMDKGITGTGQGFDAPSAGRLGSHAFIPMHNPPEHKMADAIRRAAEARAQKQSIMPAGPRKLGGSISCRGMSPAQAAAAAAERRVCDNLWCGAEHSAEQVQCEVGSGTGATSNTSSRSASPAPVAAVHVISAAGEQQLASSGTTTARALAAESKGKQPAAGIEQQPAGVSAGTAKAEAVAAAAAQAALRRLQQQPQRTVQQLQQPALLDQQQQQAPLLQEQWQWHVQRQRQQRQQQQQTRKRAAELDAIDLTLSDNEIEDNINKIGESDDGAGSGCPCCSGLVTIGDDDPTARAAEGAASWRAWCARHRQQRLDRLQAVQQHQQRDRQRQDSAWACTVCTLVNKPLALQCEACLSVREHNSCLLTNICWF